MGTCLIVAKTSFPLSYISFGSPAERTQRKEAASLKPCSLASKLQQWGVGGTGWHCRSLHPYLETVMSKTPEGDDAWLETAPTGCLVALFTRKKPMAARPGKELVKRC